MNEQEFHFKNIEELKQFIENDIVTTKEATDLIGCSRQNIKQLVDYGTLNPIKVTSRERLFFESGYLKLQNEKKINFGKSSHLWGGFLNWRRSGGICQRQLKN
ncbi:hypothetical protein [Peribacillus muralis]|uniref:hypothetical protein n=1 Tax=Peribacillus muralis TaxID=264697 RepID=UPI000AB28999|nr:hypothetical protein [Peribacillus muralis]